MIGQSLTVEEDLYTVVGIMPPGFDFPGTSSFWLNRWLLSYPGRYARWMDGVARLESNVELEQDLRERDVIEDPRVQVFPEYTDLILRLAGDVGYQVVPCAGWTREMSDLRSVRIGQFEKTGSRASERSTPTNTGSSNRWPSVTTSRSST